MGGHPSPARNVVFDATVPKKAEFNVYRRRLHKRFKHRQAMWYRTILVACGGKEEKEYEI
jgi:hypothetical protein